MEQQPERCALCAHEADLNPPPPLPANTPFTHFPCGHSVHTICHMLRIDAVWAGRMACPTCDERVLDTPTVQWLRQIEIRRNNNNTTVQTLWNENELFREQVREAAKLEREASKKRSAFSDHAKALVKEWKEKTDGYKSIVKNMQETFLKRFREIPGKAQKNAAEGKAQRAKRLLRETYDLGYYELEGLNRIHGAPKIGHMHRRWRRYNEGIYLFRFRV